MEGNKSLETQQETQNATWRPINSIRPKVIGIAKKNERLLVCEVRNDLGEFKGWCPLGGGIEFGETAENALKREILEEVGCAIHILGSPKIYENMFEHHGVKGHEIIFALPISFDDLLIYAKTRFQISEDRGSVHWVEWVEIERLRSGKEPLFPLALAKELDKLE